MSVAPGRVGRPPSCTCGECAKCKKAAYMRKWYAEKSPEERRALRGNPDVRRKHSNVKMRKRRAGTGEAKIRQRARDAVANAIRDGRLTKGPCEKAGPGCDGKVHAHHTDYAKPLDVRWLCEAHHREEH